MKQKRIVLTMLVIAVIMCTATGCSSNAKAKRVEIAGCRVSIAAIDDDSSGPCIDLSMGGFVDDPIDGTWIRKAVLIGDDGNDGLALVDVRVTSFLGNKMDDIRLSFGPLNKPTALYLDIERTPGGLRGVSF